jgi:hypothetical protein
VPEPISSFSAIFSMPSPLARSRDPRVVAPLIKKLRANPHERGLTTAVCDVFGSERLGARGGLHTDLGDKRTRRGDHFPGIMA